MRSGICDLLVRTVSTSIRHSSIWTDLQMLTLLLKSNHAGNISITVPQLSKLGAESIWCVGRAACCCIHLNSLTYGPLLLNFW